MKTLVTDARARARKATSALVAVALTFGLLPVGALAAYADERIEIPTTLTIDSVELASGTAQKAGYFLQANYTLADVDGKGIVQASYTPEVKAYVGTTSQHTVSTANTAESTTGSVGFGNKKSFAREGEYAVVLGYNWSLSATKDAVGSAKKKKGADNEYYAGAKSAPVTVTVAQQPAPVATDVVGSLKNQQGGSFTVTGKGSYQYATATNFSSIVSGDWKNVPADGVVSGLASGTYWLRGVDSVEGGGSAYTYYLGAQASDEARVVVPVAVEPDYTVTLAEPAHYSWRQVGAESSFAITGGSGVRNLGVVADQGRYIESVTAEPADAATVAFDQATGNISITNVSGDFTLSATSRLLVEPTKLEVVDWELLPQGAVDALFDADSVGSVQFTVKATGAEGQVAPEVELGFSTDNEASAYDLYEFDRATGLDGLARFKVHFPVGAYDATFTADEGAGGATLSAVQHIAVATQATPVLRENAISNVSAPGAADGGYAGLPDGLEYFTYPLKSTEFDEPYFRYGSTGETGGWWEPVADGAITGLSAGAYAVRAAQRADKDAETVYLFSDYATFSVTNAYRTVTADVAGSSHVTFAEAERSTKQNGTVYFNVKVDGGYVLEAANIAVDYPGYARSVEWLPTQSQIRVTGVTRNLKLAAKAVPVVQLTSANVALASTQVYTGQAVTPEATVTVAGKKLVKEVDYTVAYADNVQAGTAKITVQGKGKYAGAVVKSFQIAKTSIAKATFSKVKAQKLKKRGRAVKPKLAVAYAGEALKAGKDYTLSYKNNKKKGTAKVVVKGKGRFVGSKTIKFKIR